MKSTPKTNDGQHSVMVDLSYCHRAAACRWLESFYPTYESLLGEKLTGGSCRRETGSPS
jgi:hypothetical protein